MKRILFLGGAPAQVAAIKYAIDSGYYVITCDYKPTNPGHKISHEYHNISTVLSQDILELAENLNIDGITAFASDPAALVAAYVSEKLNLPCSGYSAVSILSDKGKFREFLKSHNYNYPEYFITNNQDEFKDYLNKKNEAYFIKPVDSSGSKGISLFNNLNENLEELFKYALKNSKKREVIIERKIEKKGPQIHGEGFVVDGNIVFIVLGDQYFSPVCNHIPMSTTFPSLNHQKVMDECFLLVQKAINDIGYKLGGLNIEIIRDEEDNLILLELGARNGGNFMPQLAQLSTNVDLISLNVEGVLGNLHSPNVKYVTNDKYCSQLIIHAYKDGIVSTPLLPNIFLKYLNYENIYYYNGQYVYKYKSSTDVLGVQLFCFDNKNICESFIDFILNNPHLKIN